MSGFKDNVKDEFIRDSRTYENLIEIIEIAVDLDDKLYERAIEKRYDRGSTSNAASYSGRPFDRYNSSQPKGFGDSYYGPTLIELDSI